MKVLHLSTYDEIGGAARSAYRFHRGMIAAGIESRMLVQTKVGQDPSVESFASRGALVPRAHRIFRHWLQQARLLRQARGIPPGFDPFSGDRARELIRCGRTADIVNLHWVAGFVDPSTFFRANPGVPVVWRFSDLNPITGGCHYDAGCGRYLHACRACPQRGDSSGWDVAAEIWARKKRAFSRIPPGGLNLVAQSTWMAEQMRLSPLVGRFPIAVIANGVDTGIYRPTPRPGLRSALSIPDEECVVLFVAAKTRGRRKGLSLLQEALSCVRQRPWLISVGGNKPSGLDGERHIWLGRVENDRLLAAIYNAADIFVLPSLQDNLPNTAIEALACGTPVVGFDAGGLRDIVDDKVTGRLVPLGDTAALAEAIAGLAADRKAQRAMRQVCRERALERFDMTRQVERLSCFYTRILDKGEQGDR